jgi:beta-lactamase class D
VPTSTRFVFRFAAALLAFAAQSSFAATPTAPSSATRPTVTDARFAAYGHPGTFLLQRDGEAPQVVHGAALADVPLRPASTFKVLLALVALETGALKSADEVVPWDGRRYPNFPQWQRDMALREAMQVSSEAYFRTVAARVGRERLADWVQRIGYGNGRIGQSAPDAWHDGVLRITARQQLAFVDRLRRGDLPFSAKTFAAVKAAMRDDDVGGMRVYGKTGTHVADDRSGNAWWIGWVEGPRGNASFVLGATPKTPDDRAKRIALGKALLADAGLLPKP